VVGVEVDGDGVIESVEDGVVVVTPGLVDWFVVSGAVVVGSVWPCVGVVVVCGVNDGSGVVVLGVVVGCVVGSGCVWSGWTTGSCVVAGVL